MENPLPNEPKLVILRKNKHMKCFKLLTFVFVFCFAVAPAQKIGVVDTDYILSKLPQYKDAEERLNSQIQSWQSEIQKLQSEYDKKKATLENERVLLVGDQLKQREKEVDDLDKKIKTTINNRFGTRGEINNARKNLAKPFQDQIWNAIKTVSEKNSLGIVLDKTEQNVLFLEKRYDYTDKVLNLLLKNQPKNASENTKGNNKSGSAQNTRSSARGRVNAAGKVSTPVKKSVKK